MAAVVPLTDPNQLTLSHKTSAIRKKRVVDPNTLYYRPEFWPNLDPNPKVSVIIQIVFKKKII